MEPIGSRKNVPRARSFRQEDYGTRRTFLRSYPLHWGGDDNISKELEKPVHNVTKVSDEAEKPLKKIIPSIFNWGGKTILICRRYKNKVTVRVISCLPVGFRPPAMISAR